MPWENLDDDLAELFDEPGRLIAEENLEIHCRQQYMNRRARIKQWQLANRDRVRERHREANARWRAANIELERERGRQRYRDNRDAMLAKANARNAAKRERRVAERSGTAV